ncbi:MAG TPA: hypothetical protein VFE36_02995 [Candidatus Baltobacteraceae bacterium]|jgi:hypothetical protein|nr:hypothetical protein [Candidatus Baltobacteraceae bacterium]
MRRILIAAAIALSACGGGHKQEAAADASAPPLLIDGRGTIMPLEKAVTHIAFRPYVPAQAIAFAVLPPLGDLDINDHRGLGVEYQAGRNAMLLSEWPKQGYTIQFGRSGILRECQAEHYSTTAVAWTTPGNLLLTLQPDGPVDGAEVNREAQRLIRAGACPR